MADSWFFEVLPSRPLPYSGECLSGYLLRLAEANGYTRFWDLISDFFPMWPHPARLLVLRWEHPVHEWGRLPLRTQLALPALRSLTVAPLLEKFRSPLVMKPSGSNPGSCLYDVVTSYLQVCPLCLQEQPYVRLIWRLALIQGCLQHGTLLQARCPQCGAALTVVGQLQQHLRCGGCGLDLRRLPVVEAPVDLLAAQQRRETDLRFLLDPTVTLVKLSDREGHEAVSDVSAAIGLKLRYLRLQAGLSVTELTQRLGVWWGVISKLERGRRSPLPLYLAYLDALSMSWSDFAALEVPDDFGRTFHEPFQLHLRQCPNAECPNHQVSPGMRVIIERNDPERHAICFHCLTCGRRFTRAYDGELRVRPRNPPLQPESLPSLGRSAEEIARLKAMGLRGESNLQIARQMHCGRVAVHHAWISLGIEQRVHQAQVQRRIQQRQQRHAALRTRVEAILQALLKEETEITRLRVEQALGRAGCLRSYPELIELIYEVAQPHNAKIKQQQYEALKARLTHLLEPLKDNDQRVTIQEITRQVGLPCDRSLEAYPELYEMVRRAVGEHQTRIKAVWMQRLRARIDEVAMRLVAQGVRLTYRKILKEAGLNSYRVWYDPVIHGFLQKWIGDFDLNN